MIYFALAFVLDRLVPDPRLIAQSYRFVGLAIFIIALSVGVWALRVFRQMETTYEPFGKPSALVVHGPYRVSRNPMYIATAFMLLGVVIYIGRVLFFLVPVAFVLTVNVFHIAREEELLKSIFGPDFDDYKKRVRRWL